MFCIDPANICAGIIFESKHLLGAEQIILLDTEKDQPEMEQAVSGLESCSQSF